MKRSLPRFGGKKMALLATVKGITFVLLLSKQITQLIDKSIEQGIILFVTEIIGPISSIFLETS